MKLKNKIALITGGSSGIGFAIAELFIREGAKVVITGTNQDRLEQAQKKLGNHCLAVAADVTSSQDTDNLYQKILGHFQANLDVLVANAGIVNAAPLEQMTEEIYDTIFTVNVKGTFFTIQKSLPYLNPKASIILISSLAAKSGMENFSAYCASKAAIVSLTKSFAAELIKKDIRVNSISPGVVKTPIFNKVGVTEQDLSEWSKLIPMKRVAASPEIASAALYLASDDSSYVTAADIAVDGGLSGISLF